MQNRIKIIAAIRKTFLELESSSGHREKDVTKADFQQRTQS